MANFFKEEINQIGDTIDKSIKTASEEIQTHVDKVGAMLNEQRSITKNDLENLIDYAAARLGESIDTRVKSAKNEIAALVTEKVQEVRLELTSAANEQKRTALRNASVAMASAMAIGLLSMVYRKYLHGEIDLMFVFRATLAALATGHIVWLVQRHLTRYMNLNKAQRNLLVVGTQYLGILRPKGALGHVLLLVLLLACWVVLNFWDKIKHMAA